MVPILLLSAALVPAQSPAKPTPSLGEKLAEKVSTPEGLEGKYRDVGAKLAAKFELPLVFGPEWKKKFESGEVEEPTVKVPVLKNVRLGTLLRLYAESGDGAYLVHPDTIRVVPDAASWYESGLLSVSEDDPAPKMLDEASLQRNRPLAGRALLTKSYAERTLREILADVAATTGATVVLSPTAQKMVGIEDPEMFKLTATFANTPVDAAVRTLADMSDLAVLADANVLLVTTPDKVRLRLEADREKRQLQAPFGFGMPGGFGCGGVAGAAQYQPMPAPEHKAKADLDGLQKQADELKKRIAEMQKQKK